MKSRIERVDMMGIKRFGGEAGSALPFARAVAADGWLYCSGQVPIKDGKISGGDITAQTHLAIKELIAVLKEAGYGLEHVVRCGVWLQNPADFTAFNAVYRGYFGAHPPARATVQATLMVDCKVEIDCVAYKKP